MNDIDKFLLDEFYSGKSVKKLIEDFIIAHPEYTPEGAKNKIYRVLYNYASVY